MAPAPHFHRVRFHADAFSIAVCLYLKRHGVLRWHSGHVLHDPDTWYTDDLYRILNPAAYRRILDRIRAVFARLESRGHDGTQHSPDRYVLILDKALRRYRGNWYGPTATRSAPPVAMLPNEPDVLFDYLGGNCPVQAEGTVDGVPFTFRSRGERWSFGVGRDPLGPHAWSYGEPYGTKYEAGWISQRQALDFIALSVARYRNRAHATEAAVA